MREDDHTATGTFRALRIGVHVTIEALGRRRCCLHCFAQKMVFSATGAGHSGLSVNTSILFPSDATGLKD